MAAIGDRPRASRGAETAGAATPRCLADGGSFRRRSVPESGVETALRLSADFGITASLFFLGEYVRDPAKVEQNVRNTIEAAELLGRAGLDAHVSIDPTAVGFMTSATLGRTNAERIASAIAGQPLRPHNYLMLDMEDHALLAPTLALHAGLLDQGLPAAITLQARLRRTEQDVQPLVQRRTAVRLVKGAFPLGPVHDHRGSRAITESFLRIGSAMLSEDARRAGFYPVFATHDDALARQLIGLARSRGWEPEQYEFEMLYGVRPNGRRSFDPWASRSEPTCRSARTGGRTAFAGWARTPRTPCSLAGRCSARWTPTPGEGGRRSPCSAGDRFPAVDRDDGAIDKIELAAGKAHNRIGHILRRRHPAGGRGAASSIIAGVVSSPVLE